MNRLSPYNLNDPLVRAALYRELRSQVAGRDEYEISLDELTAPEKIGYRYHGTPNTKLVVAVCAELDDLRASMEAAKVMQVPDTVEIRERIRYYEKLEARLDALNENV